VPPIDDEEWVSFGRVAKAHGIKGGLRLHLWNDEGETLRAGLELELRKDGGKPRRATVAKVYGPALVLLDGVPDRTAAEPLQGSEVFVRRSDFPEPAEGEGYLVDLIGARVVDVRGAALGTIVGFVEETAQPLAEVKVDGRDEPVLVPFVEPLVVRIEDDDQGDLPRVVLDPPIGLFDPDEAA
jgi:16S rRNA processing protein RimM